MSDPRCLAAQAILLVGRTWHADTQRYGMHWCDLALDHFGPHLCGLCGLTFTVARAEAQP